MFERKFASSGESVLCKKLNLYGVSTEFWSARFIWQKWIIYPNTMARGPQRGGAQCSWIGCIALRPALVDMEKILGKSWDICGVFDEKYDDCLWSLSAPYDDCLRRVLRRVPRPCSAVFRRVRRVPQIWWPSAPCSTAQRVFWVYCWRAKYETWPKSF